ncbi:zinc finger transcription factor ace1 [Hirsutella rhossiliensis]|uniref:Zinc finger transcription factor ace1 n=1 Tax=Hirsutella rhossiliensis TaxID=111463 RepID=A0A9P8N335_9HYPO|nr:zinc finger transcription factor ace1 [Hirsutella rhossiliensis]KAH0966778.1 zinc finger transcription factor ace1 [Hirsutella rhossiliensis]
MRFVQKQDQKTWPYACDSVGRARGYLHLGVRVGRVECFEAIGPARSIFNDELSGKIVAYLRDNSDQLPDSGNCVDLSLFMVGKSAKRSKPIVLFVSEDKPARREAFRLIKDSGIMKDYQGFELGNMPLKAEFESLRPLVREASAAKAATTDENPTASVAQSICSATSEQVSLHVAPNQPEDEEEIMRSMARRKRNARPEELAPKRCRELGCNKEFKRPCDLTKHEKTHSRPWKCPYATCKYHEFGWPTEKEMVRHVDDKHLDSPTMFECFFAPCPYKSKRESNCKQHMEKAHGWLRNRNKPDGKMPSILTPPRTVSRTVRKTVSSNDQPGTSPAKRIGIAAGSDGGSGATRLLIPDESGANGALRQATAGGLVSFQGIFMFLAVCHCLDRASDGILQAAADDDEDDECEITGLADFEDFEDDDMNATGRGSLSPLCSQRHDPASSESLDDAPYSSYSSSPGPAVEPGDWFDEVKQKSPDPEPPVNTRDVVDIAQHLEVVMSSRALDTALLVVDKETPGTIGLSDYRLRERAIPLEDCSKHVEPGPRDAAVRVATPDRGVIRGTLSGTVSFIRLPHVADFHEVYTVNLMSPLVPGDCGSWSLDWARHRHACVSRLCQCPLRLGVDETDYAA